VRKATVMKSLTHVISVVILVTLFGISSIAEQQGDIGYTPSPENLEVRTWFQDAKFGLFVHSACSCTGEFTAYLAKPVRNGL